MNLLKNLKERVAALEEKASEKKVASANLYNSKWYRFAKLGSYNALGLSFIVDIWTRYSSINNSAFTLAVNVTHNAAKITQLSGLENVANVLDKVRVVKDTSDDSVYLEVYYGIDAKTNLCRAEICSNSSISMLNFVDTTETVTVLAELDLQTFQSTITNDNGTAIKFADGTMICRKTIPKEKLGLWKTVEKNKNITIRMI